MHNPELALLRGDPKLARLLELFPRKIKTARSTNS